MNNTLNFTDEELAVIKVRCDNSLLFFTQFFYKLLRKQKFITNWHHEKMTKVLEDGSNYIYDFINFNIPPRHSKTELVAINFPAWSISKNPMANFLIITSSDDLRSDTSIRIRDIIMHPVYYRMYGIKIKKDQSGKNLWKTTQGGGLKTATIGGQITGFGAGRFVEIEDLVDYIKLFEGAIILDDINKIEDVKEDQKKNAKTLSTIFTTILSRKNNEETPIINIQQRAGVNDATAVLLDHFKNQKVKSVVLPVISDGIPLWKKKFTVEQINNLKDSPYTSRIFDSQYMQNPTEIEGNKFKETYFEIVNKSSIPDNLKWEVWIDGAYTDKTENDPTGFWICAKHKENLYIKFASSQWLEMPELLIYIDNLFNIQSLPINCRIFVEPKASGITLRQYLKKRGYFPVLIENEYVNKSKIERSDAILPVCESGNVKFIEGSWNKEVNEQLKKFPNDLHDEYVDLICYSTLNHFILNQHKIKKRISNLSDIGL